MKPSSDIGRRSKAFTTFRRGLRQTGTPTPKVVWLAGGIFVVVLILLVAQSIRRQDALISWRNSLEEGSPAASWPEWNPSWPSLTRPRKAISVDLTGPYAFAALNAERLRFIPCYCGCAREGHGSVLNCFVQGFTPQGAPIWTDHAFTCPLCLNIVREVSLMSSRGVALPAMRDSIDEHHRSMFARPTSTPRPHLTKHDAPSDSEKSK